MRNAAALFAASVLAPALAAQIPTLKPGQYEIVSKISVPGSPAQMPEQKFLHCYTPQEIENLAQVVAGRSADENCKLLSSKLAGSMLTFATECAFPDGSRMTSSGEATFTSQDSYRAVVNLKRSGERGDDPVFNGSRMAITAKRIGDCAK